MARTKNLISFPKFNDCKGDLSKRWYVEYAFRVPGIDQEFRYRTYNGLCGGSEQERRQNAAKLVEYYTDYLKSGRYLTDYQKKIDPVKIIETYRPETQRYTEEEERLQIKNQVAEFLKIVKQGLAKKTYETYKSKLELFQYYIEEHHDNCTIREIDHTIVVDFFVWILETRGVCRLSIEKYVQIVRALFRHAIAHGDYTGYNPVQDIPRLGKVVDCAPVPFDKPDRERLKYAIEKKDPYLWLACEIQYYSAVRPGTELRLLKVKDVDRYRDLITIHSDTAKNGETATVAVPHLVIEQMERLGIFEYDANLYIFGRYGCPAAEPVGKNTLRNRFNRYREALGISEAKKFYSWKHTGAIEAIEADMPIIQLKDHLRHKSIATTEIYIRKRSSKRDSAEKFISKL